MGFNTTVNILNDGFDQIDKHPEQFVAAIRRLMNRGGHATIGNHIDMVTITPAVHADEFVVYAAHGNNFFALSPHDRQARQVAENSPDVARELVKKARALIDHYETVIDAD